MSKVYMSDEIYHLGVPYFAEERHHNELIECKSGDFIRCMLIFSGCSTVEDYFKWQDKGNSLEIRYWDAEPSAEERACTPWTPYILYRYGNRQSRSDISRLTEAQFRELQKKYVFRKQDELMDHIEKECYTCDFPKMEVIRNIE